MDENNSSNDTQTVGVVIVAAGKGERAGSADMPKQYRSVGGKPMLRRAVEAFAGRQDVGGIVVVIPSGDGRRCSEVLGELATHVRLVDGGATRQASVLAGLQALREAPPAKVLIHDAARPFVDTALIGRVIEAVGERQAALPALAVSDTLKRADAGLVSSTVARDGLYAAQTPQGFPFWPLHAAHMKATHAGRNDFTDDAAIAEWVGIPVKIVEGSSDNIKLTWPGDIEAADRRLGATAVFPDVRTGNGYDVHAFEPGDHLWLCGVKIPHPRKLSGHSDADVALHALTDALLATCGSGDIGTHFPPSDPQWKDAASRIFVEHAVRLVRARDGRIANADMTLICEAPRIAPHREAMIAASAAMLGIEPARVSVKATTNERLGFLGREEGIAAIATATVIFPGEVPG